MKADGPDTWIVERKKDGKTLIRATWKLAKDGSTLTDFFREFVPDGSTMSMDYVYQRNGAGSGFAADWRSIKETMNTPAALQVKAYQGDGLSFVTPSRQETKNVRFDGRDYPNEGQSAGQGSTSSIRRVGGRQPGDYRQVRREGDGYRGDWALDRSEDLDYHGALCRPRQKAECDGVRAEVTTRFLSSLLYGVSTRTTR